MITLEWEVGPEPMRISFLSFKVCYTECAKVTKNENGSNRHEKNNLRICTVLVKPFYRFVIWKFFKPGLG